MNSLFDFLGFDDDNMLFFNNGMTSDRLSNTELIEIKKAVDKTLEVYKKKEWSDEDIRRQNDKKFYDKVEKLQKESKIRSQSEPKKVKREGCVYLAQNTVTGNVKIGFSKNPKTRVSQLNRVSEQKIVLVTYKENCTMDDEKRAHNTFEFLNLNSEWFEYNDVILNWFK